MIDQLNIVTLIAGAILIVLVVFIESWYLYRLKKIELENFLNKIRKLIALRKDFLPFLIETCRDYNIDQAISGKLIAERKKACRSKNYPGWDASLEKNINHFLKIFFEHGQKNRDLKKDIRFLEIKGELSELTEIITRLVQDYNRQVSRFNRKRFNPIYLFVWVFRGVSRLETVDFKGF